MNKNIVSVVVAIVGYSVLPVIYLQSIKAEDFQYATGAAYCISHALMMKAREYFEYVHTYVRRL